MDPKKRTTIIVLLFLTILLGVVSVVITTQIQRNNAARDSQAGNFEFQADLQNNEFAQVFSCEQLAHDISLVDIDIETTTGSATQCNFTVGDNIFTVALVNDDIEYTDEDSGEMDTYFATLYETLVSSSSTEIEDNFSHLVIAEDTEGICHMYYGATYLDGTYINATFSSEESCVLEGGADTLSTISIPLVNFVYSFLGNL